jgi:hypothetical protein
MKYTAGKIVGAYAVRIVVDPVTFAITIYAQGTSGQEMQVLTIEDAIMLEMDDVWSFKP